MHHPPFKALLYCCAVVLTLFCCPALGSSEGGKIESTLVFDEAKDRQSILVRETYSQEVELVGHVERKLEDGLVVLGRHVRP